MTRLTLRCFALAAVALLLTGSAAAASTFEGVGRDDPRAKVTFEKERGKIKRFTIQRAKFSCADGHIFRDDTRLGTMDIRRTRSGEQKFSGHFSNTDGTQTARLHGTLTGKRAAIGYFRLLAVFDKGGCDTGRVDWKARAAAP